MLLTFVWGWFFSPEKAGRAFFDAASQIIPVLLVAFAIEGWLFRMRPSRPWGLIGIMWRFIPEFYILTTILTAEMACLGTLAVMAENDVRDPRFVWAAMSSGLVGVCGLALYGALFSWLETYPINDHQDRREQPDAGA
jgi:hypothetical protein